MKCLTVCQPWAHLIIHHDKRIENRTRRTHYRGKLAVHAGLSTRWLAGYAELYPFAVFQQPLQFGAILGLVDLVDCVPLSEVAGQPYATGPWCWILANPEPLLEPVPLKGRLGLFDVPDDLIGRKSAE
ncbi:MAG TPA: ASCH domain-containing protein [Urbifossiella sp.]|nr:ASCH domain-containing protein [Urbifossiella sp.]